MKTLVTHPGRHGDCLWALPTMRALAEAAGGSVDLLLPAKYGSAGFCDLLQQQWYLGRVMVALDWQVQETAPITPREPPTIPGGYDRVIHLAYDGWPQPDLARATFWIAQGQTKDIAVPDYDTPWLSVLPLPNRAPSIAIGFSDEHFELKYGLARLLWERFKSGAVRNVSGGPRWVAAEVFPSDAWGLAACVIKQAKVFVGCCSGLHVLACALGKPVIVVEPAQARHHEVFYPLGKRGQVTLLLGGDGAPTVDSRHLIEAIEAQLKKEAA